MKAIKILFTIICFFFFQKIEVHSQAPTNGLVAYYPFSGNANDASSNNRNGTISGGVNLTTDRFGVANQAYAFNGSNGYINVANWSILNGNAARTMMVWFKTSVPANPQYFLAWGNWGVSNYSAIGTYFNGSTRNLGFTGWANDLAVQDQLQYYDNQWHLIAVTFDGSTLNLYLDGISIQSKTTTLNTTLTPWMRIGLNYDRDYFNGSLDDVRIYNRALSVSEVQQTYVAEAPTASTAEVIKLGADRLFSTVGTENTYVGLRAGAFANGVGSTFLGQNTGLYNSGNYNTFIGDAAGNKNTTGTSNSFLGVYAGFKNTIGTNNTFTGRSAGEANISGNNNTYVGHASGIKSTIGNDNAFLGFYAGSENTTGIQNTYIGGNAGQFNDQGNNNTFLGYGTGLKNTASENTFIGRGSGAYSTTGIKNTHVGFLSGLGIEVTPNIGNENTFIGHLSGPANTTGSQNVFVGQAAGYVNADGFENTFIGKSSGGANISGDFNTFLGFASGSATTTGSTNMYLGHQSGIANVSGNNNIGIGKGAGANSISGNDNLFLGSFAQTFGSNATNLQRATAIGHNAKVSISDAIVLGDTANANLKVGIGTTRPGNTFELRSSAPNTSGLRLTNLTSNSPTLTGNSKALTVNNLGDVILVPMSGGSGTNTHSDSAFVRTLVNTNFIGGNLGIGVAFPNAKLDVDGDINIAFNKNLKFNGNTFLKSPSNMNTFIGVFAGNNTSGFPGGNTFIGNNAGGNNTNGSFNTYLGHNTGGSGTNEATLQRSVAIGYNAKVSINDAIILGDTANVNLKVGIGTTRPGNSFELRSQVANTSGLRLTNLTSNSPTLLSNNKALTVNNLGDIILVPMIGGGTNTHSDSAFVRTLANTNFIGGNLGIGVVTPQYKLDVNGDIRIGGSGSLAMQGGTFIKNFDYAGSNTSIGYDAGGALNNSSGIANTFLGTLAGRITNSGSSNTFIGRGAGLINTSGFQNVFLGYGSGANISTGYRNTFLGYNSGSLTSNHSNLQRSGAVGYNARVSIDDAIVLGDYTNTNLKIGIGMHDPQFKLDVKGPINIRGINGGLGELKFMSYNFLQGDKNFNSAIGFMAEVDSQYAHSTAIGYKSNASANNVLVLGGMGENAVNVGIGNAAPQSSLEITSKNEGESGLMFTNLTQNFIAKLSNNKFLSVDKKGKVGLYNLSADQITLKISNPNQWSDKVFASNYQLMPINKVEDFINTEKHLPNIPSAKEMTEKGISTQEMFAKLLEKNEELMLYVLEQNKMNIQQSKKIEELEKEIQKLKK